MPAFLDVLYPPNLPGLAFNVVRRPKAGSTDVQTHVSGREVRLGYWTYPLYEWDLTYSVLRDFKPCPSYAILSELKQLEGFFLNKQGSLIPFFFNDPDDNFVRGQGLGIGDGVTTNFLLIRTFGDPSYVTSDTGAPAAIVTEPVGYINLAEPFNVYLNGVLQPSTSYTISQGYPGSCALGGGAVLGLYQPCQLNFNSPPGTGQAITVDMSFYFWARFNDDYADFEKFADRYWLLRKITLDSLRVPGTPVLTTAGSPPFGPPPPPPPGPPPPPPIPLVTVTPASPVIADTTPLGAVVAAISVVMSDGSPFTGTLSFGAPNFSDGNVYALSRSSAPANIIVNPSGPGIAHATITRVDQITIVAH